MLIINNVLGIACIVFSILFLLSLVVLAFTTNVKVKGIDIDKVSICCSQGLFRLSLLSVATWFAMNAIL